MLVIKVGLVCSAMLLFELIYSGLTWQLTCVEVTFSPYVHLCANNLSRFRFWSIFITLPEDLPALPLSLKLHL